MLQYCSLLRLSTAPQRLHGFGGLPFRRTPLLFDLAAHDVLQYLGFVVSALHVRQ